MNRFDAARIKLDRAKKHVADFERIVLSLPDSYTSTIESNEAFGAQTIHYFPPDTDKLAADMAVIIGDAIHNFRTAIEYSYLGTVEKRVPSILDSHTKLPIGETRKAVEDALKGRKVDVLSPALFDQVLDCIKPYNVGGNGFIKYLHDLDVSDKHWLLIPVLQVTWICGIALKDERGKIEKGNTVPITGPGPYTFDFSRNREIYDKGKIAVDVIFGEANPLKGSPVLGTLQVFSRLSSDVIHMLDRF